MVVDKHGEQIICVSFANGKRHDLRLFKESKVRVKPETRLAADTGYQGIAKIHANSVIPKKRTKKNPLTKAGKAFNHAVSSERVTNEHVIGFIKRFKILACRYRNRRKRFALRFNLICGICNFDRSVLQEV